MSGISNSKTKELDSNFELSAYLRPLGFERFLMEVEFWDGNKKWLLIPAHEWQVMLHNITLRNTREIQTYNQIMSEIFKNGVVKLSELKAYRDDWGSKKQKEIIFNLNRYQVLPITYYELGYDDIGSFIDDNLSCETILNSSGVQEYYIFKVSQSSKLNPQHIIFILSYSGFKLDFLGRNGFDGLSFSTLGNRQPASLLKNTMACNKK